MIRQMNKKEMKTRIEIMENIITFFVQSRGVANWEPYGLMVKCGRCQKAEVARSRFCPNCGAYMWQHREDGMEAKNE